MEYPVEDGHPNGAYAAVSIASELTRTRLPLPNIHTDGLDLFDGEVYIEPGIPFQVHKGYAPVEFDTRTHPGIAEKYRYLDHDAGLGREILLGGQDPETGLWYIGIKDLEIILVKDVPTPFHFPHKDYAEAFWGEVHILEEQQGSTLILLLEAPYVETY